MQNKKVVFLGDSINSKEPLGIQRYAYEILKAMDSMELPFECQVLIPESQEILLNFNNIRVVKSGSRQGFWWRQLDFPQYCKKNRALSVDLTLGLPVYGVDIVCLHDCIYENYPEDFVGIKRKLKRYSYLIRAKRNVKKSRVVITVSNTSKNELKKIYSIPDNKVTVINDAWQHYCSIDSDESVLNRINVKDGAYWFSLGSQLPHKNFKWIECAAINNPKEMFVVTGTERLADVNHKTISNIIYTGFLKDTEVKALMKHCKAFIHPALQEGFGIPPLEALSCGAQILISNSSCLPEIYGEAASYFDPLDYDNSCIEGMLHQVRDEVISNLLNKYSWEESAKRMIDVIKVHGGGYSLLTIFYCATEKSALISNGFNFDSCRMDMHNRVDSMTQSMGVAA